MDKVLCTVILVYLLLKKRWGEPAVPAFGRRISRNRSAKLGQQLLPLFWVGVFCFFLEGKHTFGSQWLDY